MAAKLHQGHANGSRDIQNGWILSGQTSVLGIPRCDEDSQGVRMTDVIHNEILLVCCVVLMRDVSAHTKKPS